MSENQLMPRAQIDQICKNAIDDAKRFNFSFEDYSEKNVAELEMLLGKLNEHFKSNEVPAETVEKIAVIYGVYLGEAMLRNYAGEYDYKWVVKNGEPVLEKVKGFQMCPVTKVYKRLTGDESENVYSFYNVGKHVADGSFEKQVKKDK